MPELVAAVNLSEGRDARTLEAIGRAAGGRLLDVHADPEHHRAVMTVLVDDGAAALFALVAEAFSRLRLDGHDGVHPRLGVVDVVPFTPLLPAAPLDALAMAPLDEAVTARDGFARRLAAHFSVPCFLYGPLGRGTERSLPEIRRRAFRELAPDLGPDAPHPRLGAVCVGARRTLVAYNVQLATGDLALGRRLAAGLRSADFRVLAFRLERGVQISFNLVAPWRSGPARAYDAVAAAARQAGTSVVGAELVGLVPRAVLDQVPPDRRDALGISLDQTIESRLAGAAQHPAR